MNLHLGAEYPMLDVSLMSVSTNDCWDAMDSRSDAVDASELISSADGCGLFLAARSGCLLTPGIVDVELQVSLFSSSICSGVMFTLLPVLPITSDISPASVSASVYSEAE